MFFLKWLEFTIIILAVWAIIFQVIIPGMKGTQSFPMFRREAKLEKTLEEVKQKVEEKKLENTINDIKQKEGI
jgi:hypothetical protein